jgi:hypothetical protein
MREAARELGWTILVAMHSWPETLRLGALLAVAAAAWVYHHLVMR